MPEQSLGRLADLVLTGAQLDAAGFASGTEWICALTAQRDAANFRGAVDRLLGTVGHAPPRNGDAEAGKELFGLVLVDVHSRSAKSERSGSGARVESLGVDSPTVVELRYRD